MNPIKRGNTRFLLSSCLFAIVFIVAIGAGIIPQIAAENYGIRLDNTCKTMLINNISSNCPSYEDIITLFPDTSNRKITGEFGYHNGIYQRLPTKLINSFEYYRFWNTTLLFIDPPSNTNDRIRIIEIKANLGEYKLPGSGTYDPKNHSLTLGVGRYIDSCRTAYVDSSNWVFLVGDSINHMKANCSPESTTYVDRITTSLNRTVHDIRDSYKWKLTQWQNESIERCGHKICIYEKEQPTPP